MMDIAQLIRDIKREFRLNMNGVASTRMREAGFAYKVNFGIELPRIYEIASPLPHDRGLAIALWNDAVRESRIMATVLMPQEDFTADMADVWLERIDNIELARIFSMNLLSRAPFAIDLAFRWLATDSEWRQLCALLTLTRLVSQGLQLQERSLNELRDQTQACAASSHTHISAAASGLLLRLDGETVV